MVHRCCDFLAGDEGGGGDDCVAVGVRRCAGGSGRAGALGDAELRAVLEIARAVGDDLDAVTRGLNLEIGGDSPGVGAGVGDVVYDAAMWDDVGGGTFEEEYRNSGVGACWLCDDIESQYMRCFGCGLRIGVWKCQERGCLHTCHLISKDWPKEGPVVVSGE